MAQTVDEPGAAGTQHAPATAVAPADTAVTGSTVPEAQQTLAPTPAPTPGPEVAPRPVPRRTRVMVRQVGPLSVLKLSLIFSFCMMLAVLLGLVLLYMIMQAVGVIDTIERWITTVFPQNGGATFRIEPGYLFPRVFVIGCAMVVVWSLINLMVAFLYNLISDVVGGLEITLAEKR